jgi:hypothetical protein
MASEILGLFTTPEQYQQNQLAQFQNRAASEVQMNPFQQAALGARTAGYQLGQGIGGALGGVDPQLQKITQRQQILGMIDPSNPNSYAQAIQAALQVGDQEAAFLLRNEMMKVQQQAQEQEMQGLKRIDYLTQRGAGMQAANLTSIANELFGQLKNPDGTINEQVKAKLLSFPQGRALITEQANVIPALRKIGVTGAVEVNPFQRFIDDPNAPDWIKNSAKQFSTSFNAGVYNEEQTDKFVNKLDESLGKLEPKTPSFGAEAERYSAELFNKPFSQLTQVQRAAVNKRVEAESVAKAPKLEVNLKDPTASAKASLDVMTKWEGFLKSGGDVEVANRYKSVQSAVAMANAGNPTADGALLYNIAKMYDPSGAVQEGDKKSITGNPNIPERFKLLVQGVLEGGSFTPTQRKDLEKIATGIIKNRESQLGVYRKQYVNKSKALGGTEDDILNPYQGLIKEPLTNFIQQSPNTNPNNITGGRR